MFLSTFACQQIRIGIESKYNRHHSTFLGFKLTYVKEISDETLLTVILAIRIYGIVHTLRKREDWTVRRFFLPKALELLFALCPLLIDHMMTQYIIVI
jgi:hypothetical protein